MASASEHTSVQLRVHPEYREDCSDSDLLRCADMLMQRTSGGDEPEAAVRTSRGAHDVFELSSGLKILVRSYRRGGFIQHLVKDRFFCMPWNSEERSRPLQEFAMLDRLREHDINVPQPVGAAIFYGTGKYSYRGIIALKYIEDTVNLLNQAVLTRDGAVSDLDIVDAAYSAGVEAGRMLDAKVMHRDLHPGNVLMRSDKGVVLIDFDKAFQFGDLSDKPLYAQRIAARWARSCAKHSLSPRLVDRFVQGLLGPRED